MSGRRQQIAHTSGHRTALATDFWRTFCILCVLCAASVKASPAQTFTTLVNFNGSDGAGPYFMSLVQGADGNLYGTTVLGGANNLGTAFRMTPEGTLTTLHNFDQTEGSPDAGLLLGVDGNFYGTTGYEV